MIPGMTDSVSNPQFLQVREESREELLQGSLEASSRLKALREYFCAQTTDGRPGFAIFGIQVKMPESCTSERYTNESQQTGRHCCSAGTL